MVVLVPSPLDVSLRVDGVVFNVSFHIHPSRYVVKVVPDVLVWGLILDVFDLLIAQLYVNALQAIHRLIFTGRYLLLVVLRDGIIEDVVLLYLVVFPLAAVLLHYR